MSVKKVCSHGVPFGKDDYCAGCELVSARSGLEWAETLAARHRRRIAEIEASLPAESPRPQSEAKPSAQVDAHDDPTTSDDTHQDERGGI